MKFIYNDGGRSNYFQAQKVGDCACRSICNATGLDYKLVYDTINKMSDGERTGRRKRGTSSARNGVYKNTYKRIVEGILGWNWNATMTIGSGCKMHLCEEELPNGVIMVNLSKHFTCVKDGVIHDTYDCSRGENRCVYGYWSMPPYWDLAKATKKLQDYVEGNVKKAQKQAKPEKTKEIPTPLSEESKKAHSALKRKQTALSKAIKEKNAIDKRIKKLKKELKALERTLNE